jgi:hypothetical protein
VSWLFELHRIQPIAHAIGAIAFVCVFGMALGSLKVRGIGLRFCALPWHGSGGNQIDEVDEHGERVIRDSFAILFNAHHEQVSFRLGTRERDVRWTCMLDTAVPDTPRRIFDHMDYFPLQAHSLAVLRAEPVPTATTT